MVLPRVPALYLTIAAALALPATAALTTLNRPDRPARLVCYLEQRWDSTKLVNGRYRLQVAVFDSQGNSARAGLWLTIANG